MTMKNFKAIKISSSIKIIFLFLVLILFSSIRINAQQITGLTGWNIYLDPGHSQNENVGIYGYSEAKKNLRVGLNLRQMLLDWTDIDTVYICRTNDQQSVTLTQRTDQANSLGAAHYHSIHSDASSSPTSNSTLIMWGQLGIGGPEKIPHGGKKMSNIMIGLLTAGMRTTTRGAIGDRDFYQVAGSTPYLHVNRESNMASELSEAGFHTNPTQNQLNMNASWKRLEAKTMFWTILKYHDISRPFVGTAVGIVKDIESELAVNGAIVSLNGQSDTTDTWESLFHLYSNDPNLLRNGFYYFEDIPAGTYPLQVTAAGYDPLSVNITMQDTFFTFKDVNLISNVPPTVVSTEPVQNDSLYPGVDNVVINFSRQMNKTSVEANLTVNPSVAYTVNWSNNDKTLTINTSNFNFNSIYDITIGGNAEGKYGHLFDGDGNGVGGDQYTLTIKTKVPDVIPPFVTFVYPSNNATNVEYKPVINVSFNELLKTSTISSRFKVIRNSTQTNATGLLKYYVVNGKSVLNFFITAPLVENESYTVKVLDGLEDIFGNPTPADYIYEFTTGNSNYFSQNTIDNFESGINNWWQPSASNSTVGINPLATNIVSNTTILNANTASTKSLQMNYEWDTTANDWLIREYFVPAVPSFQPNTLLQVFMFGDGSNNKLSFDSFQLTYANGNPNTGTLYFDDVRTATFSPTDVEEEIGTTPVEFSLQQNYPNPFNPSTQIKFSLPQSSNVKIIVTDILGKEITTLVNDNLASGNYSVNFNASNLASGIYFYTLITDNFKQSKKMILMK